MKNIFKLRNISTVMMVILLSYITGIALNTKYGELPFWVGFLIGCFIALTVILFRQEGDK